MAEKSDGNPKDTALGEREQFDSFDRLQKVDQKDLNVDKLKATDKDSDSEELLATKDRTHYTNIKEESGIVKFTNTDLQLDDNRKIEDVDLASIENFTKTGASLNKNMLSKSGNLLTDNDFKKTTGTQSIEQNSNTITGEARISSIADREQDINPLQPLKTNNTDIQKDPSPEKDTEGSQDKQNDDSDPKPLVSQQPGDRTGGDGGGGTGGGGGNNGDDHDNGHGNDDSNPGNGGGNNGSGHDNPPTPPVLLPNGNYSLTPGQGFSLTIDSIDSDAGYNSSFGHYFADNNGNPISGSIDFTNVKESLGIGDSVIINYAPGDIPPGAVTVGFFIIPNGDALNPLLPEGANVTFSLNDQGQWATNYNGTPINGEGAPVYFSDPNLNPDGGISHSNNNAGQISFEDLFGGSSDGDYNDVIVNVQLTPYTGSGLDNGGNHGGGVNADDHDNGHGNDDDGNDDSNPGNGGGGTGGGGGGNNGDDHDNGHGNDDDHNDDSNPGNGGGGTGGGGGNNGDDHDNGHGNDEDHNDDNNPGNGRGTGTGGSGGDHNDDNGHSNDDNHNDDSNPDSGGGNNSGSNSRANEENGQNNDKSNLGNNENIKDINNDKENNNKDFNSHDNQIENGSGKDDNNSHTVNDHSGQADTNISAMDSNSWTDIVSKDSDISSQPITSNWVEQVDSNHEADIVNNNDKDHQNNNSEDSHHETTDDTINNDDKSSSNHNY